MHKRGISALAATVLRMYSRSSIREDMFLEYAVLYHLCLLLFFSSTFQSRCYLGQWSAVLINFPNTGALRQSGNPSRTVGNGHSNNNNTKSNLNYALKRLGQINPQNKHKWGGGEAACDRTQGGERHRLCVDVFIPDGGIWTELCLILGVRVMMVFILGNESMSEAQRVAIIKAECFLLPAQTKRDSLGAMDSWTFSKPNGAHSFPNGIKIY